jgi:thioredoxin 1
MVSEVEDFEKDVKNNDKPVVVDFWAEWCGPCKQLGPIFESVSEKLQDKLAFFKCNVDNNQEVAVNNGVQSIPTMIVFREGEEVDRIIGSMPEDVLKEKLESFV